MNLDVFQNFQIIHFLVNFQVLHPLLENGCLESGQSNVYKKVEVFIALIIKLSQFK